MSTNGISEYGLKAVAVTTGSLIWQSSNRFPAHIKGNIIYTAGRQTVYANDLQTGAAISQVSSLNNSYSTPSVNNTSVFIALCNNHFLLSYNAQNGNVTWQ